MAKWIKFERVNHPTRKTKSFIVMNKDNGSYLGEIKWNGSFRQYSFFPQPDCVFEKTCLRDIADFLQLLMDERKDNVIYECIHDSSISRPLVQKNGKMVCGYCNE